MALVQVFNISESEDGANIYIDDDTPAYNAMTAPNGYGSPNLARNEIALILVAKYKASTGDETMTVAGYDPETVEQLVISATKDGHCEFDIYNVLIKTGSETPSLNDFVYNGSSNQLERWNGSSWVSASAADLETYDAAHSTLDYPHIPQLWLAKNQLAKLYIQGCKTEKRNDIFQMEVNTNCMISGVIALFAEHSYSQAQENIEDYQSVVDKILTLQVS